MIEKNIMGKKKAATVLLTRIFIALICLFIYILFMGFREIGHHQDKMWLHRCNSIEKLNEKYPQYPNIEVDVVFRKNSMFDITHDIDTSFNLYLDSYFAFMENKSGKIWLDIKNLTPENKMEMFSALEKLVEHYSFAKERLIIESPDWESLEFFTQNGYYTSYYVAYKSPSQLNDEETNYYIEQLQKIADSQTVCALSFPGKWYTTIKKKLNRPIDLLTWEHRSIQLEVLISPTGRKMLHDPQLKVILVKDKGHFHR